MGEIRWLFLSYSLTKGVAKDVAFETIFRGIWPSIFLDDRIV
jgi:hypothetical protein